MKPEPYVVFVVPGNGLSLLPWPIIYWFLMVPWNKSNPIILKQPLVDINNLIYQDLPRQQAQFENHTWNCVGGQFSDLKNKLIDQLLHCKTQFIVLCPESFVRILERMDLSAKDQTGCHLGQAAQVHHLSHKLDQCCSCCLNPFGASHLHSRFPMFFKLEDLHLVSHLPFGVSSGLAGMTLTKSIIGFNYLRLTLSKRTLIFANGKPVQVTIANRWTVRLANGGCVSLALVNDHLNLESGKKNIFCATLVVQHFKETTVIWDCEMHNLINRSLALVTVLWNFPFRWRDSDDVYSQKGSCENISWGTVLRNKIFHRDSASASDCPMELRISQAGTTVFALKSLATFIPLKKHFWWDDGWCY